jgi:molecular chaperone GrpE
MSDETKQPDPEQENDTGAEPSTEPEEPSLEDKVVALEDKYRRAVAELANLHRRFQRERERMEKQSVARFVEKLMPMIDNLAHALKGAQESHDAAALIEGFKQIEGQMLQIFDSQRIKPIETVGQPFDPEIHHAMVLEPTDAVAPGTVIEELGKGFMLDDIVIRAAQVKVAAPPPQNTTETERT